ncbi:MAG: TraR/DksA family transcriptional regulator [Thermodesulfovibrionales bacterium]
MTKKDIKKTKKSEEQPKVDDVKIREENLRKLLLQKRKEIINVAMEEIKKFQSDENKQLVETVLDDGDLSVVDLSEDISLKQLSSHRENLLKIDTALQKLKEGSYGICEDCGEEISEKRLEVMPFAIYCRDCQEKKELMSKLEQITEH